MDLPANEVIGHTTTQSSKQEMLTTLEFLLQQQTLKIHTGFRQLLEELASYRLPDASITQDSVIALAIAVANRQLAHDVASTGRIDRGLLGELNQTYGPANLPGASLPWVTRN